MKKNKKMWIVLAGVIFLAVVIFWTAVFFWIRGLFSGRKSSSAAAVAAAPAWNKEDMVEQDAVILFAAQNRFLVGEPGVMELTVLCRQDVTGPVTITDDREQELAVIESDGSGMLKTSIDIFGQEPRYGQLIASVGEEVSTPLSFYIVPDITEEMADRLLEVSTDLGDYVAEAGFEDPFGEDALKEITAWLEADERVSGVKPAGEGLLFETKDSLMGSYGLGRVTPNTFGFVEAEDAFELHQNGKSTDGLFISSEIPVTNQNFLHLSPIPRNEMVVRFGPFIRESEKKLADRVGAKLNWSEGEDAVRRIAKGDFTDYGFMAINTHGNAMDREEGGKLIFFNMGEATRREANRILAPLGLSTGSYNGLWGMLDVEGTLHWTLDVTPENEDQRYSLMMSSNYLETALGDRTFDNTVLYFIVCEAMSDQKMVDLLHRHGASVILGCPQNFEIGLSIAFLERMADVMGNKEEPYAFGNLLDVFGPMPASINNWIRTTVYNDPESYAEYLEAQKRRPVQLSALAESPWRVFYGEGTVHGRVLMENKEPAIEAEVVAYRWLNHKFQEVWSGTTDSEGFFKTEKIPYGIYGIAAKKDEEAGFITDVLNDGSKILETEDIILKPQDRVQNNGGNVVGYDGNVYYWKYSGASFSHAGTFAYYSYEWEQENQLICRSQDGSEKVLLTAKGSGPIFISGDRIYLNYGYINSYSVNLDGKDRVEHGMFKPWAADEKNGTLIGAEDYSGGSLVTLLKADHTKENIFHQGDRFLGMIDGYCYFSNTELDGLGLVLYKVSLDGSGLMELDRVTTQSEEAFGLHACQLTQLGDTLYYSYGYYAGSGGFFQQGGINCVDVDGSNPKVCVEYGDLTAEEFMVEEADGQPLLYYINNVSINGSYIGYWNDYPYSSCLMKNLDTGVTESSPIQIARPGSYVCINGDILLARDNSTVYREVIPKEVGFGFIDKPDEEEKLILIPRLDVVGNELYFTVDWSSRNREYDIGWRPGYTRDRSNFYTMEIGSKEATKLYSY